MHNLVPPLQMNQTQRYKKQILADIILLNMEKVNNKKSQL